MKIGIMQGRLSPPVGEDIQEFPYQKWKDEFDYLDLLPVMPYYAPDVDDIEWIVTTESFARNPLFNTNISFKDLPINAVCADAIINKYFPDRNMLESHLKPIVYFASLKGIRNITIPLLDDSSIMNKETRRVFTDYLLELIDPLMTPMSYSFEFEATEDVIDEILNINPRYKMTYDTGNMTSFFGKSVNHKKLLTKYIDRINNIHLKDRTFDKYSVEPGEGDTDFVQIFETLSELRYDGQFTLQTARGTSGRELTTISRHLDYFFKLMEIAEQ